MKLFLPGRRLEARGNGRPGGALALPPARHGKKTASASQQQAIGAHLSHDDFYANEALLRLSLLAFNLASMLRIEYEAEAGSCFDLARFQRDVLKAGGRIVKHARRLVLTVARVVVPFWRGLIDCLRRWRLPDRFPAPRGPRTRTWRPPPRHAYLHEVRRL